MKTERIVLILVVTLIAAAVFLGWWQASRFWDRPGYVRWHMGPGHMMGYGFGGGGFMGLVFWSLVLAALILAIVWISRMVSRVGKGSDTGSDALEILKQRFARGEIDRKEYEDKLKDLRSLQRE